MINYEMKYRAFQVHNFRNIPQIKALSDEEIRDIEITGNVFPFKVNNYVIDELIDWDNYSSDPIFRLTFPQKEMLEEKDFATMKKALDENVDRKELKLIADSIREKLNPHPAGQMELNVPEYKGEKLHGVQHKYKQTLLILVLHSMRSEEHTSELQSRPHLVCRLLLEKKKKKNIHK